MRDLTSISHGPSVTGAGAGAAAGEAPILAGAVLTCEELHTGFHQQETERPSQPGTSSEDGKQMQRSWGQTVDACPAQVLIARITDCLNAPIRFEPAALHASSASLSPVHCCEEQIWRHPHCGHSVRRYSVVYCLLLATADA